MTGHPCLMRCLCLEAKPLDLFQNNLHSPWKEAPGSSIYFLQVLAQQQQQAEDALVLDQKLIPIAELLRIHCTELYNGTSQIVILQGSTRYWTSGQWNGRIFSLVPEMRVDYLFNYNYFINKDESYFNYSLYDSSIISRMVLDVSGQIEQMIWLESSH